MRADWLTPAEAWSRIRSSLETLRPETRSLHDALGHVLAEEIASPLDLPPWDNSAMDGFAARAADVRGASDERPVVLRVVEDIPAGRQPSRPIGKGEATRIMTGAPVPEGADSVIRVEHTNGGVEIGGPTASVTVRSDGDAGRNIRRRGEDVRTGEEVLRRGTVLAPAHLGVAAGMGRSQLSVVRRPSVAVLASGDELVEVDGFSEALAGRRIVSTNSYTLRAQLAGLAAEVRMLGIAADRPDDLRKRLEGARGVDALITSAGVSVGEHDHLRAVLADLGLEDSFWRIGMRPGSPFAFGRVRALGGIPWFGLPGNPVSSMVGCEVFVKPALRTMAGRSRLHGPVVPARPRESISLKPGLVHFLRVRLLEGEGTAHAIPTGPQGSGILTSMAAADGLLVAEGESLDPKRDYPVMLLGDAGLSERPPF